MAAFCKSNFMNIYAWKPRITLTLLSLELGKVLASFPFSPFLLLDLDFVMFLQQMLPKIRLTAQGNTSPETIYFPTMLQQKRAKIDSESTNRRISLPVHVNFTFCRNQQVVDYKIINR